MHPKRFHLRFTPHSPQAYCPMCMQDDETILHAPCGHGHCRMCWEGLVLVALQDSSTTKVKTGAADLLDVSKLMCPGCTCVSHASVYALRCCLTSSAGTLQATWIRFCPCLLFKRSFPQPRHKSRNHCARCVIFYPQYHLAPTLQPTP